MDVRVGNQIMIVVNFVDVHMCNGITPTQKWADSEVAAIGEKQDVDDYGLSAPSKKT